MEDNKNVSEEILEEIIEEVTEEINETVETEETVEAEETEETVETEEKETAEDQNNEEENDLDIMRKLKDENKKLNNELEALKDRLLRVTAEYDNYRKRTSKEKEGIYNDSTADVLKEMIPVLDNLERAMTLDGNLEDFKKGIDMTIKSFKTSFEKLGVEEIDTTQGFDPNFHQAVMHIQDENYGTNEVAEVFQKGYKKADKIIRYTMVKVAN